MLLRTRITLSVTAAVLLVALALIVLGMKSQAEVEERFASATMEGKEVIWRKIVATYLKEMEVGTKSLTRDRKTIMALKKGDLETVTDLAGSSYNLLSQSQVLTRLQIADPEGNIIYSAPEAFSGPTTKSLVGRVLSESKPQKGIERDDDGRLMAEVVVPLFFRAKPVGVGIFLRELQAALEDFKASDGSEVVILNPEGEVEYATQQELFTALDLPVGALGARELSVHRNEEQAYSVVTQPVIGASGDALAHLISAKDYTASLDRQRSATIVLYLGLAILLILVLTGSYWYMRRSFTPLNVAIQAMKDIAKGEEGGLTRRLDEDGKDEAAALAGAFNMATGRFAQIIGEVKRKSEEISCGSDEIARGTNNLSRRTEEQAASLEETASSMDQMTATVKQNADNARQANNLASGARKQAEKGGQVVGEAVSAMSEINSASKKIADIIGVIDEIAFQTNLLALNAAVEAARAGEQGRGFAVVASEVRNLAQRSATAAKEIKSLIADSVIKVEQGSQLVDQSGQTLEEIVTAVKRVSDIVAEIAAASTEQSSGIEQVNKAIMQMDDMTQQNAALVEQAAAASEAMDEQARSMKDLVGFFKVSDQGAKGAAGKIQNTSGGNEGRSAHRL